MADLREFVILNPRFLPNQKENCLKRLVGNCRMAVRRLVLQTNDLPRFRSLYSAVYRFHVWVLLQVLRRYKGTRAVYLIAGMGRNEVRYGISDIDVVVIGDWSTKRQMRLIVVLACMIWVMPLLDRESLGCVQTWEDFLHINNTDLFLAYRYASAKLDWKLLWGEDLIQNLPELSYARRAGAGYMEVRRWWVAFIKMALGENVTSRDPAFRNSISFKAVADVLRAEATAKGQTPPRTRIDRLRDGLNLDQSLLSHLLQTEASRFLSADVDLRTITATWLLQHIEQMHTWLPSMPTFAKVASFRVVAEAEERLLAPATVHHVEHLVDYIAAWKGFRAAYLLPSVQFLVPDTLGLFLEFDETLTPTLDQLRALCAIHLKASTRLTQRIRIYLLLKHGAYLLDFLFGGEIWGGILIPQTNPDIFTMLSRSEFVLHGSPRPSTADTRWSMIGQRMLEEELMIRKGAHARFGVVSRSPVDNLRNLWRYLQLIVMARRTEKGEVAIPSTIAATRKILMSATPTLAGDLQLLERAMLNAVEGRPTKADGLIQKVYASSAFQDLATHAQLRIDDNAAAVSEFDSGG